MDVSVGLPEASAEQSDETRPQAPIWAEPRHLFFFRLATLLGEVGQRPVELLALAESGVMARVSEGLREGERLELEINSHHRFDVRVEWSSGDLAGLEFEDRDRVREALAARDRAHPYRAPRLELSADVVLRLGDTCVTARARDVSEGGIKVELAEPDYVGRETGVIVPGMPPVEGRILWCRDGRAGISFERPLPFRSLSDCFTRHRLRQTEA